MVIATAGEHLIDDRMFVVAGHLRQIAEDGVNPTVWSVALGPAGWVLYGATVVAALWWYRRVGVGRGRGRPRAAGRQATPAPASAGAALRSVAGGLTRDAATGAGSDRPRR